MDFRFFCLLAVLGLAEPRLVNLKCKDIKKFVDGHNLRRQWLAQGKVSGQPQAKKMNAVVWDKELAAKAAKWASREKYGHNPDKKIPSGRFSTGENIYIYKTTVQNFTFDAVTTLVAWFREHEDFQYRPLRTSDFGKKPQIGHYTQMAWSNSIYIGCAISNYKESKFNVFFVVCNYGPAGNVISQVPYEKGNGSGKLTCGADNCNKSYGDSC